MQQNGYPLSFSKFKHFNKASGLKLLKLWLHKSKVQKYPPKTLDFWIQRERERDYPFQFIFCLAQCNEWILNLIYSAKQRKQYRLIRKKSKKAGVVE